MKHVIETILLEIIKIIVRVAQIVIHYVLCLVYTSRGQTVPCIRDPILQMSATELAEQIREGKLTSECVVRAFIDRILTVDPLINATIDRRFNGALQEAREADAFVASGTMNKAQLAKQKPLLGVPFTLKVLLTVKGLRCSAGSLLFKDLRAQEDAIVVARMKEAGAIVLAITNCPEFGMNLETVNHIHGTTCNPYDTSKTCGASSGGESALLAAGGSVIGLGNDLCGSIRIPCMFCGIFGHKSTRGLVPNNGCFPVPAGKVNHYFCTGPMCRYAQDLVTTMKILASSGETRDMIGEQEVSFEDLKVYCLFSFGDIPYVANVDPEIRKCVQKVASYFETKHGSKVKEVNIPLLKNSNKMFVHDLLSAVPNIAEILFPGKTDLDPTKEILKFLFGQSQLTLSTIIILNVHSVPFIYDKDSVEHYQKLEQRLDEEFDKLLDDRSVLILPTLPFAAPYHNEISLLGASLCYAHIFNLLGHPVTQCPVGFNGKGLPIGVQIVGRRGNDYLTIACAVELEKAFGGWIPPI